MVKEQITASIKEKRAHIAVVGLGYVGLPLLTEFARAGFQATGFEVDADKAAQINAGGSYIGDVPGSVIKELVAGKRLSATTNFDQLQDCDAVIICVPTPLRKTKEPDVSYILAARMKSNGACIRVNSSSSSPLPIPALPMKCCCRCSKRPG